MSQADDRRWRELFLGYEELDAETRREVDDYLARNPAAREQLDRIRELERRAVEPMGTIDLDADGMEELGDDAVAAEKRSHRALLEELGMAAAARASRSRGRIAPRRWARRIWVPAVAAAAVLLFFFGPWADAPVVQLTDLRVVEIDGGRQTRSGGGGQLRSGDSVALAFELDREASLLVYHIDPEGRVSLVVPGSAAQVPPRLARGPVRIPGPDGLEQWVLGGTPGQESFIVGVSSRPMDAPIDLDAALRQQVRPGMDRQQTLDLVRSFLGAQLDVVSSVDIEHRR